MPRPVPHSPRRSLEAALAVVPWAMLSLSLVAASPGAARAWGWSVHRLINRAATTHLPPEFRGFAQWADSLELLSTAADERKCCVSGEAIKHYIDIDAYDEFAIQELPHAYAVLVARYGRDFVDGLGTVPWSIEASLEEMTRSFRSHDWVHAVTAGADLGHYVGDCHEPLHLTMNYDGQLSDQRGVHARHESEMTGRHLDALVPAPGAAASCVQPLESVFAWIDRVYPGAQVILDADRDATAAALGDTGSNTYYDVMWRRTGPQTQVWVRDASLAVASLWLTAWRRAGEPLLPGSTQPGARLATALRLEPGRPNPANPGAIYQFDVPHAGPVWLRVLDVRGRALRTLVDMPLAAGKHSIAWDGRDASGRSVASGVYRMRLEQQGNAVEGKAVILR